jgi:hypothetical protein
MDETFYKWFNENKASLVNKGIQTEEIKQSVPNTNPNVVAEYTTDMRIGRVTVWKSGLIDMEILEQSSMETVFYRHLEITDDYPDVEIIIEDYVKELINQNSKSLFK